MSGGGTGPIMRPDSVMAPPVVSRPTVRLVASSIHGRGHQSGRRWSAMLQGRMIELPTAGRPEDVLELIEDGDDLIVPLANGEPVSVLDAIEANAQRFRGLRVHQMHALHDHPYLHGTMRDHLLHVSYFLSPVTRPAFRARGCELVPNHFSEVPRLLRETTRCSMVLAAAAPMDRHGYFSLGTNCDYVATFIGRAPFFLEVNARMPRTFGRNSLHVSQVAGWTEVDRPLVEVHRAEPSDVDERIASHVVERIANGSTIQAGIGSIPNALLAGLRDHRDLGVHTELLSDALVDLIERGVVTGTRKRVAPGKVVTTFALGTQMLYDFLGENPVVEFRPVDYVNDPRVIAGGVLRFDQCDNRGRSDRPVRL